MDWLPSVFFVEVKMKDTLLILSVLFCALTVSSCTTKDEAYYLRRGDEIQRQLIVDLEGVHCLHDLFARQDSLTLLFDELSKVAIEARQYQLKSGKTWDDPADSSLLSQRLAQEIRRLLEIPGARPFLERCQAKGFDRIDAFEKAKARSISKALSPGLE